MTREELASILEQHKLWLESRRGGEKANLSEAKLVRANLVRANLREANLREADISGADISGTSLSEADLRVISAKNCYIGGAKFSSKKDKALLMLLGAKNE